MNQNPQDFILTTDFATLKNDLKNLSASITVPSAASIAGSSSNEWHQDISINSAGVSVRSLIRSSKNSSKWVSCPQLVFNRTGSNGPYNIAGYIYLLSKNQLRCSVIIANPYSTTMTGESGSETFDFLISTFLPPFPA